MIPQTKNRTCGLVRAKWTIRTCVIAFDLILVIDVADIGANALAMTTGLLERGIEDLGHQRSRAIPSVVVALNPARIETNCKTTCHGNSCKLLPGVIIFRGEHTGDSGAEDLSGIRIAPRLGFSCPPTCTFP